MSWGKLGVITQQNGKRLRGFGRAWQAPGVTLRSLVARCITRKELGDNKTLKIVEKKSCHYF